MLVLAKTCRSNCSYSRTQRREPKSREWGFNPVTGHLPFNELTEGFSPERKARVAVRVAQLKADMPQHELRQAPERSQEDLARELNAASDRSGGSS